MKQFIVPVAMLGLLITGEIALAEQPEGQKCPNYSQQLAIGLQASYDRDGANKSVYQLQQQLGELQAKVAELQKKLDEASPKVEPKAAP